MPSNPDRTGKNPRPLATEVTNIHTEPSGRNYNPTSELQTNEEITRTIDVPKEYREDISIAANCGWALHHLEVELLNNKLSSYL